MKKWVLSHRDSSEMLGKIESGLGVTLELPKSAQAECTEPEGGVVFVSFDGMEFLQTGETFLPYLGSKTTLALFPSATVDEGAIKFLLNGADVMRPGIRVLEEWGGAGRYVVVREEKKGRAIAVGVSTVSSEEARGMTRGSCIRNLHYVGDRYWNLHKAI